MTENNFFVGTGSRLKTIREQLGFSREKIAALLGIKLASYYKNENGVTFPRIKSLITLFKDYDISMNWFLFNEGPMFFQKETERVKALEQELEGLKGELEKERAKAVEMEREKEENAGKIEVKPEVKELVEHMERIPLLRHDVLGFFHRFKLDNRELVEAPTAQPRD